MVARWFRISFAENALRRFAVENSVPLETLHAPDAVSLALSFYRDRRAQHARITDEGDGLLWQWGPDADAERFTIDLTRQLVREDEDAITQLCLTLAYEVTGSLLVPIGMHALFNSSQLAFLLWQAQPIAPP